MISMEECFQITVSEDNLYAYISLQLEQTEPFPFSMGELQAYLDKHDIKFGIKDQVLESILKEPHLYQSGKILVAQGQEPIRGKDGYIDYVVNVQVQEKKPRELENGKVDFKNLITLESVHHGQLIARRIPADPGENGKDVRGREIETKLGKESYFKIGKNVVVDQTGENLYATMDGMLSFTDNGKVNVFPIFEINGDVDYGVGNIDFIGTVIVRGNVLSGFRICAKGDIRVLGGVEGAELIADGTVEIRSGIMAGNKGSVRAGKNVICLFAQDACIEAKEDIVVSQSVMHSTLQAGNQILCTQSKGLIVGGTLQAGEIVRARTIGNTMSTPTIIEVGVRPHLRNQLVQLKKEALTLSNYLDTTVKALSILDQLASMNQLNEEKAKLRAQLQSAKQQAEKDERTKQMEIISIEKNIESVNEARIEIVDTLYGGTKITIGRDTVQIKDTIQGVSFRIHEGELHQFSLV